MKKWILNLLFISFTLPVLATDRVAWVIGNNSYKDAPLKNPVNDAKAMAKKLKKMGYEVIISKNASSTEMRKGLYKFGVRAEKAKIAVVFYAGHGIQVTGKNYLIPIDTIPKSHHDLRKLLSLKDLMMETSQASHLGVIILDACRDNPFGSALKSNLGRSITGRGLARVQNTGTNILVSFATNNNNIAADGQKNHSPYTQALLANLGKKIDIRQVLGQVRDDVIKKTGRRQTPYTYGSLGGHNLCLTKECEGGVNGVDIGTGTISSSTDFQRKAKQHQNELAQKELQKQKAARIQAVLDDKQKKIAHNQKLIADKNKQIQDRLKHERQKKLRQLADNKKRRERVAKQRRDRQKQLDKNRKNAWEQEKKLKLRNEKLRRLKK